MLLGSRVSSVRRNSSAESAFGACYMVVHRGDFHEILTRTVPPGAIEFGKQLVDLEQRGATVHLGDSQEK